jgi:hypothetical protein
MLQDRLRLLGKPVLGTKSVLAERLLGGLVNGRTPSDDLPLASDYITDERELDTSGDEDDGEDDDDDVEEVEGVANDR